MSQKGIEQLIGKALADKNFMEAVLRDPEREIKKSGLDISSDEISQLKQIDRAKAQKFAESFATEFGNRQQAM